MITTVYIIGAFALGVAFGVFSIMVGRELAKDDKKDGDDK